MHYESEIHETQNHIHCIILLLEILEKTTMYIIYNKIYKIIHIIYYTIYNKICYYILYFYNILLYYIHVQAECISAVEMI